MTQLADKYSNPWYREDDISFLEIYDMETSTRSVIHKFDDLIEAPNWSPDGKTLAYCASRNGEYDIYTITVLGGEEKRLTTAPGLNDGPEYDSSGEYIWFNSVRSGLMQAWRMKADGSEQTQMTFDEDWNIWFPHISPDGCHVVMLDYRKEDVKPDEHLPHQNVELRLMNSDGSQMRTIASLFGGQGTINVNSWSPDSSKFAFVSYQISTKTH